MEIGDKNRGERREVKYFILKGDQKSNNFSPYY